MSTDTQRQRLLQDETLGIYGFGNTGQTLVRELAPFVDRIIVYEDDPSGEKPEDLPGVNGTVRWVESPTVLQDIPDLLVASPGIPGNHPVLRQARELGVPVWDEIELAYRLAETGTFWAVTGTNGKSTAAELAGCVLKTEYGEEQVRVCGNRGSPLIENLDDSNPERHYVVEVSSFQAEGFEKFTPDGVLLTSLGDDHREYHDSLYEYHALKFDLLRRVAAGGPLVVPDDLDDRTWFDRYSARRTFNGESGREVDVEVTEDDRVRYEDAEISLDELSASLAMFPENIMGVASLLHGEVTPENFVEGLKAFESLDYRAGRPETIRGRQVINDSKATNPSAVRKLVDRLEGSFRLVLGGGAKDTEYGPLVQTLRTHQPEMITLAGTGSTVEKLKPLLRETDLSFEEHPRWKDAVQTAYRSTELGEILVLSPGGTSFDAFDHYRDRGESFDRWIGEVTNEL